MTTEKQILEANVGRPSILNGPIELLPHDPNWTAWFEKEATLIRTALGDRVLLLEHVGSTSVPTLAAKPVIDIVLAVADSALEDSYGPDLAAQGFRLRLREPDWFEHRLLEGATCRANLHVFSAGSLEVGRMLAFRDHLRSNAKDRHLYETTKRRLAKQTWRYTQQYADAKTDVIETILARAASFQPPESG